MTLEKPQQDWDSDSLYWKQSDIFYLYQKQYNGNCQDQCSCSCQDEMKLANFAGYTRLNQRPIVLLDSRFHASLTSAGIYRKTQNVLNASLPERIWQFLRKLHTVSWESWTLTWTNLWCMPLKAARPSQLPDSLHWSIPLNMKPVCWYT